MMKKWISILSLTVCMCSSALAEITITNLAAIQRPGTKLVDVSYDLANTNSNDMLISLHINNGMEKVNSVSFTGSAGLGVSTGSMKFLTWDAGTDWNGNIGTLTYSVTAYDGILYSIAKTGQTNSYRLGDDGHHESGNTWTPPRFSDNGDETVTDNMTGLQWVKAPHSLLGNSGTMNWGDSIDFCNGVSFAGHSDWRLPNCLELESLVNYGSGTWGDRPAEWLNSGETPFSEIKTESYWSSTASSYQPSSRAHPVHFGVATMGYDPKSNEYSSWPVRGQAKLPKTGQTTSYRDGDDGYHQLGTSWPSPRFTDHRDGTVIDNMTGLQWIQSPQSLSENSGYVSWYNAIDFCEELDFAGHSDWRMPSIRELISHNDFSNFSDAIPDPNPFSIHWYYWSSTTPSYATNNVFVTDFNVGGILGGTDAIPMKPRSDKYKLWPVRSFVQAVVATTNHTASDTEETDTRDYMLTVISDHGTASPSIGENSYARQATITCQVENVSLEGLTNWICIGWIGTDSVPSNGAHNITPAIILTSLASSITWLWDVTFDADQDGLLDAWEQQYFGSQTGAISSADTDSDGYSNCEEQYLGTIPTNAQSRLDLFCTPPSDVASYTQLDFTTETDRSYTVQYRNSLLSGDWLPFIQLPGSGEMLNVKDYIINQKRYYRIVVEQE